MSDRPCREELYTWINVVSFVLDDVKLYLDTHPNDENALEFFAEFQAQRVQALREYARYYGPLTIDTMSTPEERWAWINNPWPWHEGGC